MTNPYQTLNPKLNPKPNQVFNIGTLEEAFQYDKPVPDPQRETLSFVCGNVSLTCT